MKEAGLPQAEWCIFECSGTRAGQESAWALLGFGAYLGVVGFHAGEAPLRLSNLMAFAATAEGTWGCLPEHYPEVVDLVAAGRVALEPFVETFPLREVNAVLDRLRRGDLDARAILVPDRRDIEPRS